MKSFLVIGVGKFGNHLVTNLCKYNNIELMIIDLDEEKIDALLPLVSNAKIGDCTNPDVLKNLGVANFDKCFVCIGENFQNSLEITSMVKEMGAREVISLASRDVHRKFLLKNGADYVIYPDYDMAERIARKYSKSKILDFMAIDSEYGIYEITPFDEIIGKTIREVNFRKKYKSNVIGYKRDGKTHMMLDAEYVFSENEPLLIVGKINNLDRLISD